jgi:hypothetical protein
LAKTIIREKQHGEEQGRLHIKKFVRVDSAAIPASSARTNGRGVLYVPAQLQNISMNSKKSSLPEGYFIESGRPFFSRLAKGPHFSRGNEPLEPLSETSEHPKGIRSRSYLYPVEGYLSASRHLSPSSED